MMPHLTFITELGAEELTDLLAKPGVLRTFTQSGHGISMGISQFDAARAAVVRQLTAEGIPVIARLLLPTSAGYWFNVENYPQAVAHYHTFRDWAREERLQFSGVAVDFEPSLRQLSGIRQLKPFSLYVRFRTAHSNALFPAALDAYYDLGTEIRLDGFTLYSYILPVLIDDRRAGTTLLQRMMDLVDIPAEFEVLMCYSSLLPHGIFGSNIGGALIAEYGPFADALGIGVIGNTYSASSGTGIPTATLSWDALVHDLQLAASFTENIHLFSLEGCIAQGYLSRLQEIDWSAPVTVPWRSRTQLRLLRLALTLILWWSHASLAVLGWLGWVVVAIIMLRRLLKRRWRRKHAS